MKIKEILSFLEEKFPLWMQEEYDNCGIQCGDKNREITGVLVCFELSDEIIEEAIRINANLIISHHPIIFKNGLKKIEPNDRTGKLIFKAIENKIMLYAIHTNIDSIAGGGNDVFAKMLELSDCEVLLPVTQPFGKLIVFAPRSCEKEIKNSLYEAGCGETGNYDRCSYSSMGTGSFRPLPGATPSIGIVGNEEIVNEERIEVLFPLSAQKKVIETIYNVHPYEEPAFDIIKIENSFGKNGLGRIGKLPCKMNVEQFLSFVKKKMNVEHIKYGGNIKKDIERVAVCGGSGASLIAEAMKKGADSYVSGDFRYHDFLIVENKMLLADIGHFHGEHFICDIIYNELKENFCKFAISITKMEKLKIYNYK